MRDKKEKSDELPIEHVSSADLTQCYKYAEYTKPHKAIMRIRVLLSASRKEAQAMGQRRQCPNKAKIHPDKE